MGQNTIKYVRWGSGFNEAATEVDTISQINLIDNKNYGHDLTSLEIAELQHKLKSVYFFTFFKENEPEGFVEYNNDTFKIGYLDKVKREYLYYIFEEQNNGKLFLKKAQFWEFEGDTTKKIHTDIYQFTESGDITIHNVNIRTRESTQLTSVEPIDVSGFYEDFPEFGEYDRLIRKDRMDSLNLMSDNLKEIT